MAAISINNSFTADHEKPRAGKKREMAGKMIFRNRPSSLGSAQRWENPSTVERIDLFEPPQFCKCRGAVAQLVERPSKVTVWCNSTDMGSKHAAALLGKNPSRAIWQLPVYKCAV